MTEEHLAAIKARCDAATPGPWFIAGDSSGLAQELQTAPCWSDGTVIWSSGQGEYAHPDDATGEFIRASREDVPALLAYIEELHADLRQHREERIRLRAENLFLSRERKALLNGYTNP